MPTKVTDEEFVAAWKRYGSPDRIAKELGLQIRGLYKRRSNLAKRGIYLPTAPAGTGGTKEWVPRLEFERCRKFEVDTGTAIVFSDPHWLPDHTPVPMRALVRLCEVLRPKLVVCGGDAVDGDTISRWDPTRGHHKRFTVREELDTVREHFDQLDAVLGKTPRAWTLGNHDVRLSRFVAMKCPELADMDGMRLEDWAPKWPLSWTVAINAGTPGHTVIRHRNQAGMLHLQAQKAGVHYVHGHLHRMNDNANPGFAGIRYSVDAGSLADPDSEGFDYMEGNIPHVCGFAVLTYQAGRLLKPEFCYLDGGRMWFRGAAV